MKFRRPQSLIRREASLPPALPYARLINGTVIITGVTWTAYLVGVVYHQTFLDHLGISPDLFPKQASEYFIFAFYACFSLVVAALSPMLSDVTIAGVIILIWISITALVVVSVVFEKHRWIQGVQSKAKQRRFRQVSFAIVFPILGSLVTFYVPLLIAFVLTMPVLLGQSAGAREASNYFKYIDAGCEAKVNNISPCTEITEGGKSIAVGIVVAASETHVAVLEKFGSRSLLLEGRELRKQRPRTEP